MALPVCFQKPGPCPVHQTGRCLASDTGGPDLHMAVGWALNGRRSWEHGWTRRKGPAQLHLRGANISERAKPPSNCQQLRLCPQAFSEAANVCFTHAHGPEILGGRWSLLLGAPQNLRCQHASFLPLCGVAWGGGEEAGVLPTDRLPESRGGVLPHLPPKELVRKRIWPPSLVFWSSPSKSVASISCSLGDSGSPGESKLSTKWPLASGGSASADSRRWAPGTDAKDRGCPRGPVSHPAPRPGLTSRGL